jgi:hypothetical protein
MFDRRHFDTLETVNAADSLEGGNHRRKAVGIFPEKALGAPDGLDWRHGRAAKA